MKIRQIADRTWSIPLPLSPGTLSVYLVCGSSLALIDTGYTYTLPDLARALRTLGLSLGDIDVILMTHGHADHVGACAEVGGGSTARALLHGADHELVGGVEAHLSSPVDLLDTMRALGRESDATTREAFLRSSVGAATAVTETVADGDVIDLGARRRLRVVHTPGHTPGSVVLYSESDGIAFTGDAVQGWGGRPGVLPLYFDPSAYEASLCRLRELDPPMLALGHPYRWSGDGGLPDMLRPGAAARQTIEDSFSYFHQARVAVSRARAERMHSPAELVQRAIELIGPPYWSGRQGWEAASAAALLAHAEEITSAA